MATNEQRREAAKRKLAAQQVHREKRAHQRKRTTTIAAASTVVVVLLVAAGIYLLTGRGGDEPSPQAAAPATPASDAAAPGQCTYPRSGQAARPVQAPADGPAPKEGTTAVALSTSAGNIDLTLDRAKAPCTVQSFESLVKQKYFDGTRCHRMVDSPGLKILQCGDPTAQGTGGPGYTIPDEVGPNPTYQRGQLAMAKMPSPNSGGSQFFMIYGDAQLDPDYTVFGSIGQEGLATLDKVARGGVEGGGQDGPPATPVEIRTATLG